MKLILLLLAVIVSSAGCATSRLPGAVTDHRYRSEFLGKAGIEVNRDFRYLGAGTRHFGVHHWFAPQGFDSVFTNRVFLFQSDREGHPELAIVETEMDDSGYLNPVEAIESARIIERGRRQDHLDFQYLNYVGDEGARPGGVGDAGRCRMTQWVYTIVQPRARERLSIVYSEDWPLLQGSSPDCPSGDRDLEITPQHLAFLTGFEQRAADSYKILP